MRKRLERAALELFTERGFDRTTTAQIAARAGVTERTYFRHFPDKREVLFASEAELRDVVAAALANAPRDLKVLPTLRAALREVVPLIERNRPLAALRAPIIAASPALVEREHAKTAALTELIAQTLQQQGIEGQTALLAARVAMGAFATAIRRWAIGAPGGSLQEAVDQTFAELRDMVATL